MLIIRGIITADDRGTGRGKVETEEWKAVRYLRESISGYISNVQAAYKGEDSAPQFRTKEGKLFSPAR
jgi:hypothetical protein